MNKILSFSLVAVSTILLSTSCSILSNPNEIALECKEELKLTTTSTYPDGEERVSNEKYNETYLINLKDKKVLLYTDSRITEQRNVSIAPKTIYFQNPTSDGEEGGISNEIDRETLKIKVFGGITMLGMHSYFSGGGICKKIPYPSMVSTKNKI
jgi:hypothetical protein